MLRFLGIAVVAGFVWFGVSQTGWMDSRPVEKLLFVGHSRTYANGLPDMVVRIADSADSPVRYEATMQARPGASLKDHWRSTETRDMLANGSWDHIIIQPNIVWRDDDDSSDFMTYGKRFVSEAAKKSTTSVVVDWPLRDPFYRDHGWTRSGHIMKTAAANRRLASASGAELVDVGRVWETIDTPTLPFSLYKDDDHPSVQGTYLVALVIADAIADIDLAQVDYVPSGMTDDEAALVRTQVERALSES